MNNEITLESVEIYDLIIVLITDERGQQSLRLRSTSNHKEKIFSAITKMSDKYLLEHYIVNNNQITLKEGYYRKEIDLNKIGEDIANHFEKERLTVNYIRK